MRFVALAIGIVQLTAAVSVAAELSSPDEYSRAVRAVPSPDKGGQIYRNSCLVCHGVSGEGYPGGPVAAFPVTGGQHFRVLVLALVRFRHGRNSIHGMQYFSDANRLAGSQDVADVAAYVAALRPTTSAGAGTGLSLAAGARVYLRYCESCHGPTGQGDAAKAVPRLAAQHYRYLLHRLNATADAHPIDDEHAAFAQQLGETERDAVADYLSRLLRTEAHGD
jgi:cytochrome c553